MLRYYLPIVCPPPRRPVRQPVPFWTIEVVGRGGTNAEKDMGEPA